MILLVSQDHRKLHNFHRDRPLKTFLKTFLKEGERLQEVCHHPGKKEVSQLWVQVLL
jgi:hypothetical protein